MDMLLTAFKEFFKQNLQNLMPSWNSWKLKSLNLDIKDGHGLNSQLGTLKQHLQTHIFSWAKSWWESSRQNGDPELLKSFNSDMMAIH